MSPTLCFDRSDQLAATIGKEGAHETCPISRPGSMMLALSGSCPHTENTLRRLPVSPYMHDQLPELAGLEIALM